MSRQRLRVVFMGTPSFAVPILEALIAAGHDLAAAYSQPPRPAGRGGALRRSPVHDCAESHGVPVECPVTLREPGAVAALSAYAPDALVVAAYGLILPKPVLDVARLGAFNVHASLLPRWRGAAPIQNAILAGDSETGVTIMLMDEGLDTGPMLCAEAVPIGPDDDSATLHDRLAAVGARLIVAALDGFAAGRIAAVPQPAEGASYARRLSRADGRLDWARPAEALARQVRAFHPWPGAWFGLDGETVKVLAATPVEGTPPAQPGTVLDEGLTVACAQGALRIGRVQRGGRAAMDAEAFLRGFALPPGTILPAAPGDGH